VGAREQPKQISPAACKKRRSLFPPLKIKQGQKLERKILNIIEILMA
jgi:hypothetical protein